jgi:hypothetical protein
LREQNYRFDARAAEIRCVGKVLVHEVDTPTVDALINGSALPAPFYKCVSFSPWIAINHSGEGGSSGYSWRPPVAFSAGVGGPQSRRIVAPGPPRARLVRQIMETANVCLGHKRTLKRFHVQEPGKCVRYSTLQLVS